MCILMLGFPTDLKNKGFKSAPESHLAVQN